MKKARPIKIRKGPYLIFGGTGSLARTLVERILSAGEEVAVFARDEAKHHALLQVHPEAHAIIGDIRDYRAVLRALNTVMPSTVVNAAAMKQIPFCELYPYEATLTNVIGAQHVVDALHEHVPRRRRGSSLHALFISTDKACKPVNSYGMTKALGERIHLNGNTGGGVVHTVVRYGNVLESTGSVIPVFRERIRKGLPLCVTHAEMTRFLMSLDQAVDLIMAALADTAGGNIYVPVLPSARIMYLARCLIAASGKKLKIEQAGIRPGEKLHELLISEDEGSRTEEKNGMFIIHPAVRKNRAARPKEYSSAEHLMTPPELEKFLRSHNVI